MNLIFHIFKYIIHFICQNKSISCGLFCRFVWRLPAVYYTWKHGWCHERSILIGPSKACHCRTTSSNWTKNNSRNIKWEWYQLWIRCAHVGFHTMIKWGWPFDQDRLKKYIHSFALMKTILLLLFFLYIFVHCFHPELNKLTEFH